MARINKMAKVNKEVSLTFEEWKELPREKQVDYLIENNLFNASITINEIKEWCKRHAFEKGIKDPVLNKNLNYPFSFTGRWVLALITMWRLHKIEGMEYCHYRRDVMPKMNEFFRKRYDITNLPMLAREPYGLIVPADKVRLGEDYDCDGMWKLNDKGFGVLDSTKLIKVPETVLFTTFDDELFQIKETKKTYITWREARNLNLKETLEVLKSW